MKNKISSMLIILIIILGMYSISSFPIMNKDNKPQDLTDGPYLMLPVDPLAHESSDASTIEPQGIPTSPPPGSPSPPSRVGTTSGSLIETNPHGGSWFDSFEDQSGIELSMSDHFKVTGGGARINISYYLDNHTVALWHLDEGAGSTAYDSTNNDNDGTLGGDGLGTDLPGWTTGKFGTALDFDGVDDYLDCGNDVSLMPSSELTVDAWINIQASPSTGMGAIVNKGGFPTSSGYGLNIYDSGAMMLYINVYDTNNVRYTDTAGTMPINSWNHIALTYHHTNGMISYINGQQVSFIATNGLIKSNTEPVFFGMRTAFQRPYNGSIDEVRISNIARSAIEIKDIYENTTYSSTNYNTANLTSKPITLPPGCNWDTIILNKTQPPDTYLNVTVLDATSGQPIPGSPKYPDAGEFDISYIDPIIYPSIQLNATFETEGFGTPILHLWGVSWNAFNAWKDTFFTDLKVSSDSGVEVLEGNVQSGLKLITGFTSNSNTAGLWNFNEGQGQTTNDESSYSNHGTLGIDGTVETPDPTWVDGKFGKALDFDGFDDHVDVPDSASLSITGSITVEVWLNFASLPMPTQTYGIVKKRVTGSNSYQFNINESGVARFRVDNGPTAGEVVGGNTPLNDGEWHYIAATWDQSQLKMYVDGVSDAAPVSLTGSMTDTGHKLAIAYHTDDGQTVFDPFNGLIDCVRISNIARSAQYINNIFNEMSGKEPYLEQTDLNSKTITIPNNMYWESAIINKTEPLNCYVNLTILDGVTDQPIQGFVNSDGTNIDISSIDPHVHPSIKLRADFESDGTNTSILHDWSVNWTLNKSPRILDLTPSSDTVYRTNIMQFTVNVADDEDPESSLTVLVRYKATQDTDWRDFYIANINYENNIWRFNFIPDKNAYLGEYSFNVSCSDTYYASSFMIFDNIIEVLNNPPTKPELAIKPERPRSTDDLEVIVSNVTDIEEEMISYFYNWYRNDELQSELITDIVPSNYTAKTDIWKCVVTANDGNDNGTPAETEVIIRNSPPEINNSLPKLTFQEDTIDYSIDLYKVFQDIDQDDLRFWCVGYDKIDVDIFNNGTVKLKPDKDWFGTETLTFFANDTHLEIYNTVNIEVRPTNDAPVLTNIQSELKIYWPSELVVITIDEDQWLNFTINADDIDGDNLFYSTNRTGTGDALVPNLIFRSANILTFQPDNSDVGIFYVNLTIQDNNGSEIYQHIKVDVKNTNDPPEVKITHPVEGAEYKTGDKIKFSCEWSDVDLEVPDSTERMVINWYSDPTGNAIGEGEVVENISFEAGEHQITVEITDKSGAKAYDYVSITVTEPPPSEGLVPTFIKTQALWLIIIVLIVIIIIIFISVLILYRRKQKAREMAAIAATQPSGYAFKPEIVPKPIVTPPPGLPETPQPRQQVLPEVISTPTPTVAPVTIPPQPTLASTPPQTIPYLPPAADEPEELEELSLEEQLAHLEMQFEMGELDQETYEARKQELEEVKVHPSDDSLEPPTVEKETPDQKLDKFIPKVKPKSTVPTVVDEEEPPVESEPEKEGELPGEPAEEMSVDEQYLEISELICPKCGSTEIITYPDGSYACDICEQKWL